MASWLPFQLPFPHHSLSYDGCRARQPLLLSDGQSVVAMAPVDGILHPKNALDTLGADAPEKLCKTR